jgi:hypothetical protein
VTRETLKPGLNSKGTATAAGAAAGAGAGANKPPAPKPTGRVRHDDRGNAIWEWAVTTGKFTTESSTQRLQRLDNPTLALADDAPTPVEVVARNPHGVAKGYSPYDSGLLDKKNVPRKKDLKKLSEWLALKKQAANNDPEAE